MAGYAEHHPESIKFYGHPGRGRTIDAQGHYNDEIADEIVDKAKHESALMVRPDPRKDPVGAAALFMVKDEGTTVEKIEARLTTLQAQLDNSLPVEKAYRETLQKNIKQTKEDLRLHKAKRSDLGYSRIDLRQPLRWRDRDAMPRLAVYPFDKPTMQIKSYDRDMDGWAAFGVIATIATIGFLIAAMVEPDVTFYAPLVPGAIVAICAGTYFFFNPLMSRITTRMPKRLKEAYQDVVELASNSGYRRRIMTSDFTPGAIPQEVRDEIRKAQKVFGKEIYFVAESQWNVQNTRHMNLDPIVIGVKNNVTYTIAKFDLTPLEKAISEEFADYEETCFAADDYS